jgi:hypothetical protein
VRRTICRRSGRCATIGRASSPPPAACSTICRRSSPSPTPWRRALRLASPHRRRRLSPTRRAAWPASCHGGELDALAAVAGTVPWSDLGAALTDWQRQVRSARDVAASRAAAHQTSVDERDELRARLDAYEAKAAALDLLEDEELASRHRQAREALYTAPTDLVGAARLVAGYRDELRARAQR